MRALQLLCKPGAGSVKNGAETPASVAVAYDSLGKAAQNLAQASRSYYLLCQSEPTTDHLSGGERDFEKAIDMYDSWVRALLSVVLPACRKKIGSACVLVLSSTAALAARTAKSPSSVKASDMGPLDAAVSAIEKLEVSGAAQSASVSSSATIPEVARRCLLATRVSSSNVCIAALLIRTLTLHVKPRKPAQP